ETLIVEDLGGRADDANGLRIGAVGEIKAVQPVVRSGEAHPGLGVVGMFLDRRAEALFGKAEIVAAEISLAELQVIVRIVAGMAGLRQWRDRLAAGPRLRRLGHKGAGRVARLGA